MSSVDVVVGQAGTGKTTWLISKLSENAPQHITADGQRVLVITRMHGARRRLQAKMKEASLVAPLTIKTIDGFALWVVNRWRESLGLKKPVLAVAGDSDFTEDAHEIFADFDRVVMAAVELLRSPTVRSVLGATYPLVVVDEFQDCHGPRLGLVDALSRCSSLLLAADDFQLLDSSVAGCPAMEWAEAKLVCGEVTIARLDMIHRTSVDAILAAARCLRENERSSEKTVPLICCPKAGVIAWKIIESAVFRRGRDLRRATTALISPSRDSMLDKILVSCAKQLSKRNCQPIRWHVETAREDESQGIATRLGLSSDNGRDSNSEWTIPTTHLDPSDEHVVEQITRRSRLRGIKMIRHGHVARHIDIFVHEKHAHGSSVPKMWTVTTVHGAKNREYDNVFVLWTYRIPPDPNQQRKLLYNAVTRAKESCTVLILGPEKREIEDPVLSLLGPPEPAMQKTKPKKLV